MMMKLSSIAMIGFIGLSISSTANAQDVAGLLGAPVVVAGGAVSTVATVHSQVVPGVVAVSPSVKPLADGVTSGIAAVGTGVTGAGKSIQTNGLLVGSVSGKPLVSVGSPQPSHQGSLAAVANGRR